MTNLERLKSLNLTEEQFADMFSMLIGMYVITLKTMDAPKPTVVKIMVEMSMFLRDPFLPFPEHGRSEILFQLEELDRILKTMQN